MEVHADDLTNFVEKVKFGQIGLLDRPLWRAQQTSSLFRSNFT
jgi:hypothetical protein